jgi:3-oxoacyl-[acyl-carrier protein] reductase
MDLGIKGRTALVLGGGRGLGAAMALALASEGVKVAVASITPSSVAASAQRIRDNGGESLAVTWDLGNLDVINSNVSLIEERLGPVDILVNNTGGPPPTSAAGQPSEVWTQYFQSMVLSVIAVTDRVLPGMRRRHWGRIITSTSAGAVAPIPNLALSNTLRMSLHGWSKTLAQEVGKDGITSNIVVPGRILTDRIRFLDDQRAKARGTTVEAIAAENISLIPLGRLGDPKEYGAVVAFLASECAAYITGSVIRVDGGMIQSI